MSHVTTISLFVDDLESLAKACERIGLELVRGQKTFKWFGRWVNDYNATDAAFNHGIKPQDYGKCEHAIRVKGNAQAYEIGLVKRPDGKRGYAMVWDFFAGGKGLCEKVSYDGSAAKDADRLKDWYSSEVSAKAMRQKGFTTQFIQLEDGVKTICRK